MLWLVGHPGCGKTTLSSFLAHYFDHFTESDNPRNVLVYYCDDKITQQKDANAIISGLIFQLIQRHRSLIRHVRKVYEMHGSSLVKSLSALWGIFRKILGAHKGPFYIVIDALDECENASRLQLLEAIYELITNPPQPSMSGKHVKFLISSRPTLSQLSAGPSQVLQDQISLDEDQPGLNTDLRLFIQQRVDEVSARSKLPLDVQNFLLQTLCSKADRSFLWAHLTLSSIENSLLASMKNFRDIIGKIPPDLETAYSEFLFAISSSHQNDASRLLKLILSSSRPLHLEEINIAFTIEPSHFSTEDVTRDCQPDIARTVQGILGPLVRISDSRVSLVHQSAKDFLLRTHGISPSFPSGFAISPETSALEMSNACILYLLLDQFDCDLYSAKASPTELSVGSFESTEEPAFEVLDGGFFWGNEDMDLETAKLFHEPDARDQDISPLISSTYELYAYASLHWAEAFAICEQFATAEIREGARTLLDVDNNSCRNWLRYYSANVTAARVDELINFEPITLAAYFNLQLTLTALLQNSTGPSHTAIDQGLFWAARVGHARIIATLLEAGADPNGRGPDRKTPIIAAAEHSHLDCIITLLTDTRTDLSVMDRRGRNALSFACGNGQESIVKELLTRAPRTANQLDYFGTTPFFWATGGGYIPVVITMLRQAGLDINHQDNTGRTVTSWAAGDGMDEVLKRLIKLKGIEANLADKKGKSPLIWAAGNGHAGAVSILSRNRVVNKGCLDKDRRGAISWACGGGHAAALRVLIQNGCPGLDDEDIDGWTPLAWSIQTDSPESVQALISTGRINIERRDRQGRTALSWAVEYGHVSVVRVLLKGGADPEVKSNNGTTPIMVAEKFKHMEILDELKLNRGQV